MHARHLRDPDRTPIHRHGVQIKADGYTLMQNFVLSGPSIVSTGGVGVTAAQIADVLERQVDKYAAAVH